MPETQAETGPRRRAPRSEASKASTDGHGDGTKPIVCNVAFCPICMAVTAAQGAAPDAVEHLLKAAREFFLAARAVIDTRADHLEGEQRTSTRLEKIEIT